MVFVVIIFAGMYDYAVLSGESWNVMKLKFSIKNLRERLAKGLVDKGVLGTESQSFGLFEMATHPLKDPTVKEAVIFNVRDTLLRGTTADPRRVVLCCMAYACNVIGALFNARFHSQFLRLLFVAWPNRSLSQGLKRLNRKHT
eukprot:SAG11_NODE_2234_length_3654_cov_7.757806_2_plen_143_part_00